MLEAACCLEERLPHLHNTDSAGMISQPSRHWGKRLKCPEHAECSADGLATTSAEGGKIAKVIRVKGSSEQKHTGQSEGEADEAEMALVARLAKAEENIRVLHSALTATQRELLDLRCKYKEEMASKAAEIGVRMSDLEKANRRAETAQREVERLTEQLAVCSSAEGTTTERRETGLGSSYMSTALLAKDKEIARLQEDVQSLQRTLQDTQEHSANQIAEMERQLAEKAETIERLEAKLRSQQDYEKIKTELSILKSLRIVSDNGNCLQESLKAAQTTDKEVVLSSLKDTVEKRGVSHNCDESLSEEECPRESARPVESHASPQGILRLDECPSASPDLLPQRSYGLHPFPAERHLFSPPYKKDGPALLAFSINPHPTSTAGQSLAGSRAEDGEMEPHTDQSEGGGGTEEEPLETLEIAQQVKEQLLKHNIGQRVFGHYVLGLSQGSVSEILARPKPWSKLTVKGKEPFVKMKQFLSDEQNILALRTIQVRQRGSITPRIRTPETGSDDAIKNILEQAKKEIQSQRGNDGKASPGSSAASSSTRTSNGGGSSSDDNIKNILERARLEMQAQRHQQAMQEMEACGWAASRPPSSLPITIKREGPVCPQAPLSILSPAAFVQSIIRKVKSEIGDAGTYFDQHWASEREGAGLQPSSPASPSFSSSSSSSSSLGHQPEKDRDGSGEEAAEDESGPQPMKTEAVELLVSGDSLGSGGMAYYTAYVPRALKPTVPPLTPEQYETYMYREVDTIELTRLVKEKLAKSGICQRIFGEKVLGLSQGSVSDMLSRPKPWGKLTQKGREPFIRMQLWLQDPVGQGLSQSANQSLCPDTSPVPMATHSPPSPLPSPKEDGPKLEVEPILLSREGSKENQHPCDPPPLQEPPASKGPAPSRPPPGHTVLGIQELVGLSPELDTQLVTKRVKEVLTNNNLGQRLFGESVLGLTQGSVSDLLSRPKPWHKLSLKGREPFVRMQLWLSDPHNVEKLRDTKKMEKKVCTKRRYGSLAPGSDSDSHSSRSDSVSPVMTSRDPYGLAKKPRVVLASREKEALIKAYVLEPYPSQQTVEMLASQLGLKTNTVINWFHNYRSRMRREVQQEAGQENDVEVEPPGFSPSAQSSIPNQQGAPWGLHYICPPGSPGCFVSVKMEDEEQNILAQKESSDRGKPSHIDEGVQIPCLVKKEFEDPEAWCIERSSGRCCPKSPQEDRVPLGQSLGGFLDPQRAAPLQREAEDSSKASVDPVSFKASSEPSRGSLEVPLNSPSAASSPGMVVSISPIPSSSDPISPTPPNPSHNSDPPPNLRLDKNTQRLKEKVANLNSIIHRLERAANKEDTLEWEF